MSDLTESRSETLARLAQSRAAIRRILDPEPEITQDEVEPEGVTAFPRSRTMKMLMSGRGLGTVGAIVGGLLMARPAVALRLIRMLPTGAVARMLLVKGIAMFRSQRG